MTLTALGRGTRSRSSIKSRVQREPEHRTTSPAKVTHPHGSGQGEVESPRGPATHSRTMTQREKSASLAPPPGLWPFSPVSLPFHGGEVRSVRAPSRPSAVLPRFTAVPRGRSPFCSRPLPAFGTSPPFHCRSTGENLITDLPWRGEDQGRHHVPRVVRRAIGCF